MADRQFTTVLGYLRKIVGASSSERPTDRVLLQQVARRRDSVAFAELVQRHGPMVLRVCRQVLQDSDDAEDAFQATFLVLFRKAGSVGRPALLGNWLYGVAYRVARRAKAQQVCRRRHERASGMMKALQVTQPSADAELGPLLHEEVNRLPAKYRVPIVLCYLEGKTKEEAARELGWPAGTVSGRLARARELLRSRFNRRGLVMSGAVVPGLPGAGSAPAAVPIELAEATVEAALLYVSGQAAGGALTAEVLRLAQGILHTMVAAKVKCAVVVFVIIGMLGTAAGVGLRAGANYLPSATLSDRTPDTNPKRERGDAELASDTSPKRQRGESNTSPTRQRGSLDASQKREQADSSPSDPLEQFRKALRQPILDPNNREEIQFRRSNLEKRAQDLRTIGDIRQALALEDWLDQSQDQVVVAIDGPVRQGLIARFVKEVRGVLTAGTAESKLAAAAMLGEMGVSVRGATPATTVGREFAPDLVQLLRQADGPIQATAAHALARIGPEPAMAAAALRDLLGAGRAEARRAAAGALVDLARVPIQRAKRWTTQPDQKEAAATAVALIPIAGHAITDADPAIRQSGLEAIGASAEMLGAVVHDSLGAEQFPPPGRKPTAEELTFINAYQKEVEEERALLLPVAHSLAQHVPAVGRASSDRERGVCLAANQALESMTEARLRLAQKAASVPLGPTPTTSEDPLAEPLRNTVPFLAARLTDQDMDVRLASLYVLETLGAEAAPALAELVRALGDPDPFVRWGAVRALGKLAPLEADQAVSVLARRLEDENQDVRLTAAAALERFGPKSADAIPALTRAVDHPDPRTRVGAIQTLASLRSAAVPVIAKLSAALAAPETQVRLAAARALAKLGPAARAATADLRKALTDWIPEVRQAASDAMLAISTQKTLEE
jgi:RNA polymerase sigma factor (sigma-70 family)